MKLASKTAIVTGAARGIGFGIACACAEGARVIIADRGCTRRSRRRFLRESGAQALFISCNIAEKRRSKPCFPSRRGVWPGRHSGE